MLANKKKSHFGIIIFILLSVAVISTIAFIGYADYSKGRIAVEATAFQERYHGELKWYATYTIDGQTYKSRINGNNSNLSRGRRITVYYNPNNPNEIWRNSDKSDVNLAIGICIAIFVIICALMIFNSIMVKKKQRQLEESGELYEYQNPYESNADNTYNNNIDSQSNINKF